MTPSSLLHTECLEDRIAPAGLVTVAYESSSGALSLAGDDLDNSIDIFRTGPNSYHIEGLFGTLLAGPSGPVSGLDIGKLSALTIKGNAGADDVSLTDLMGLKSFTFDGGAGLDFVIAKNIAVKDDVTLNLGADSGLIAFSGDSTAIGGDVKADYGTGGGSVDFFATSTVIKGAVKLIGGDGVDSSSFGGLVKIDKGIAVTDAGLGMSVAFQSATATIGKAKNGNAIQFAGGSGNDSLKIVGGNVSLRGNLAFTGDGGTDTVDLEAARLAVAGSVNVNGGADADVIKIAGPKVAVAGSVTLLGESGADIISLSADDLSVCGPVRIDGGIGDDSMSLASAALSLYSSLAIRGGDGANVATVFADGSIRGSVLLDMGGADGAGDQTFLLGGLSGAVGALKIGGHLSVDSDATDPTSQGSTDFFWATDVAVRGNTSISMGAVDSTVNLDNVFLRGGLFIATGDGNDTVDIEQNGLSGPSIIARLVSIQLGAGDDTLRIGRSSAAGSNDSVVFRRGVSADGGPGTDISNDFLSDTVNVFTAATDDDCDDDRDDDRDDDDEDDHEDDHEPAAIVKERLNFEAFFPV